MMGVRIIIQTNAYVFGQKGLDKKSFRFLLLDVHISVLKSGVLTRMLPD
jgi:hypothetical protein